MTAERQTETDVEFLHRILSDKKPHNLNAILRLSFRDRGCGLTVHSRAADLRRRLEADGLTVANWKDGNRGAGSWYQIRPLDASGVSSSLSPAPDASSGPGSPAPEREHDGAAQIVEQLRLTGAGFRKVAA